MSAPRSLERRELALELECGACGAEPGHACRRTRGSGTHRERLRAAGQLTPAEVERLRANPARRVLAPLTAIALAVLAAAGCYQAHEPAALAGALDAGLALELDAGEPPTEPDAGEPAGLDGGRCVVRWYCYCDDAGACARWDGSRCRPGDLYDPADDPCRR